MAFVPDTCGCKLPLILVALGFSTSSDWYRRREETDVPSRGVQTDTPALFELGPAVAVFSQSVSTDGS